MAPKKRSTRQRKRSKQRTDRLVDRLDALGILRPILASMAVSSRLRARQPELFGLIVALLVMVLMLPVAGYCFLLDGVTGIFRVLVFLPGFLASLAAGVGLDNLLMALIGRLLPPLRGIPIDFGWRFTLTMLGGGLLAAGLCAWVCLQ